MSKLNKYTAFALTAMTALSLLTSMSHAADFFVTDPSLWFDPADKTPVQIIIELTGLEKSTAQAILKERLGSRVMAKLSISEHFQNGQDFLILAGSDVFHSEILKINKALDSLKYAGARSLVPEIPLAVRVHDLKGKDTFLASVSGLSRKTIRQIDEAVQSSESTGKTIVFRYYLDDRKKVDRADYEDLKKYNGDAIVGLIPANTFGRMPLYIPGNSVVYHSRVFHSRSVLGEYNPGLINGNLVQALTANKYVEALFWNQYAPGAIPETHLLSEMNLPLNNLKALTQALNAKFKEGWVMKAVKESSSNFSILTDKVNLVQEANAYLDSDFDAFKDQVNAKLVGQDEDNISEALQEHKNYLGWRILEFLKNPSNVIVQRKVSIASEYRVEIVGGRVLARGSTVDRHNWLLQLKKQPYQESSPETIARIEKYTQSIVDRLPPELRETNFAFDIALLKDGNFAVIESNAGSESGFLTNEGRSVRTLNNFLRKYPAKVESGEFRGAGLSPEKQMKYLADRFTQWGVDPKVQYPSYTFYRDRIETGFKPVLVNEKFEIKAGPKFCSDLF